MTITTTHDPLGGGEPRLLFAVGDHNGPPRTHVLRRGVNTVGSHPDNDLCLPGLAPFHVEINRSEGDDYVLVNLSSGGQTRVHGRPVCNAELHSGARIEVGGHVLSFAREEYADHGRPNGGRQGGELSAGPRVGA